MTVDTESPPLQRLLHFLGRDPGNLQLLADAAAAAFDARAFERALELIEQYESRALLPAPLLNLKGMIALAQQRYADAASIFTQLRLQSAEDPVLKFNLAWANAMQGAWGETLELLDDKVLAIAPRAPSLKIQALHHLGRYDEALAEGDHLAEQFPRNEALMGALATLAMDAEKSDLALAYAKRSGANPEGRAALGLLALGAQDVEASLALLDEALSAQPGNPRAWVGKGLGLLAKGNGAAGAQAIDKGAELFGDHLGSWIASGWAHFVAGDNLKARSSFERALAIDDTFAESHGGLAVLDILEGRTAEAKRRCEIALRLDKSSFSAALAKSLLLERSGQAQAAQKIREIALSSPVAPNGQTLAQALVAMSSRLSK